MTTTGTAGAAERLVLTTPPPALVQSGAAFVQQPTIQLHDSYENPSHQAGVRVSVGILSGPESATVGRSTTAVTGDDGVAQFHGPAAGDGWPNGSLVRHRFQYWRLASPAAPVEADTHLGCCPGTAPASYSVPDFTVSFPICLPRFSTTKALGAACTLSA